jgi:manganese efflux pump family protein
MMELVLVAFALSMDAFAAALSQGAAGGTTPIAGRAIRIGLAFGAAQALMPLLGWALGLAFAPVIRDVDHWVAFVLLGVVGGRMMREGLANLDGAKDASTTASVLDGRALFIVAVATSIDAAAAGVTLPLLDQPIIFSCIVIGAITLAMSVAGVFLGRTVGAIAGRRGEVIGGFLLMAIGTKILVEHLFFGG